MNKFVERFMEKSKYEKGSFIVGIVSSIIVIVFAVLQILGLWNSAIIVCEIFMGISMISQAILQWKKNKGIGKIMVKIKSILLRSFKNYEISKTQAARRKNT